MHRSSTVYIRKQSKTVLNKYVDVRGQQGMDLFTGGSIIMDTLLMDCSFILHKMLINGLESCGLLRHLNSHSDSLILPPIHC